MKILIVDDDAVSRVALTNLLRFIQCPSVVEFEDAESAWEYIETSPTPVLCCCDLKMPGMSGIDLLKKVRMNKLTEDMLFVLITSGAQKDVVVDAIKYDVSGYIVKPFNTEDARGKISSLLDANWKKISEKPREVCQRLSISEQNVKTYYQAFQSQVSELKSDCLKGRVNEAALLEKLTALKTGAQTLGLWHIADVIEQLSNSTAPMVNVKEYLINIHEAVDFVKRL